MGLMSNSGWRIFSRLDVILELAFNTVEISPKDCFITIQTGDPPVADI